MKSKSILSLVALMLFASVSCQKVTDHYMTLDQKTLEVPSEGGDFAFTVKSNVFFRVNNDCDTWATIVDTLKSGDEYSFLLKIKANSEFEGRESSIRIIGDYVTPLKLKVSQKGYVYCGLSTNEINATATSTSSSFKVLGDKSWTAVCDNPDFKLSSTSGLGETEIVVTYSANLTTEAKVANISVDIEGTTHTLKLTQAGKKPKIYVDLSATKSSNCYIISENGYYKFNACVRGNGFLPASCTGEITTAITPAKVKMLWSTYNTDIAPAAADEIIADLELKDGYVQFEVVAEPIVPANVVIAVSDNSDVILWSWHIWITDEPATSAIGGATWMDRNLGATCANVTSDPRSCGLFYQWGRKDPMRSSSSFSSYKFIATYPAISVAEVNVSETTGTIAASIANPVPFINTAPGGSGPKDWVYAKDHEDRWSDANKTMFDPCPVGYRVPTSAQLSAFGVAGGFSVGSHKYSSDAAAKAAYKTDQFILQGSCWTIPLSGFIQYNDGTLVDLVGTGARWTTSTAASAPSANYLNINAIAFNFINAATRGHAAALRCVKE